MKKTCLLLIFLVLVGFTASAESESESSHLFSLGLSVGMLSGTSEEVVYRSSSSNKYLSQLLWQMNPLFYLGIDAGYNWQGPRNPESVFDKVFSGIFVDIFFKFGLPMDSGLMEDRDWYQQSSVLTHYSIHNNKTDTAVSAGLNIGKSFSLFNEFRLSPFISYLVMYYSFSARGGVFLYPDSDGGHFFDSGSDTVVTYRQFWQIFSPGISFFGPLNNYIDFEFSLRATPLITVSSYDEHLSRYLQIINDPMYYGFYIEPGLVLTLRPTPSMFKLLFSLDYKHIGGARGNSRYRKPDSSETVRNVGGAGYSAFDFGVTAIIGIGG